jgi:hypothetical protein
VATASSWMRKSTTVGGGGRGGDSCTAPAQVGGREQPATREEDGGGRIERQGRAAEGWEGGKTDWLWYQVGMGNPNPN